MKALLCCAALAALAASAAPAAIPLAVVDAKFFAEFLDGPDSVTRVETARVPYAPGVSCFSWMLKLRPQKGLHAFRERMTLPAAAADWGDVEGNPESLTRISPRRDVATTDFMAPLDKGEIGNSWCLSEGDPQGAYRIEVFDGDRLLHRFDFTVGEAAGDEDGPAPETF